MDVQRRRCALEEGIREDSHVPVQTDEIEPVVGQGPQHRLLVLAAVHSFLQWDDFGRNPPFGGGLEHRRVRVVREDDGEFGTARSSVGDVQQIAPSVAGHPGDSRHDRIPTRDRQSRCGLERKYIHNCALLSP